MFTLEDILFTFTDTLTGFAALAACLFAIMDERNLRRLKKLPVLVLAPLAATALSVCLYTFIPWPDTVRYCVCSCFNLLACTLWVKQAWRTGFWQSLAATCMAGVFQVSISTLSWMLLQTIPLEQVSRFLVAEAVFGAVVLAIVFLLYRLRFGRWFRLLMEDGPGRRRTALLLLALECSMELLLLMQSGLQPDYLIAYYLLVTTTVALIAGLVVYLAQRFDSARKLEAQRNVIAQQQLYERDLEAIRREVRSFRHDYKNLLAGLSEQAGQGEVDALRATLSELDAGFDRRIGEKIRASTQLGNVRAPQVRSLLLSKLAAMGERGIDCRLEVLYPVEGVGMDVWDFVRCLGILLDNAAEAAVETETPWVEVVLLAQGEGVSLRVSNPYAGTVDPDKIWAEGVSTKGEGRGLGLPGYQRIVAEHPNAASSTSWAGGVFVQELTVEGTA